MARIAEFTVAADALAPGRALAGSRARLAVIDRLVPTGAAPVPSVWVFGDGFRGFERAFRGEPAVDGLHRVDSLGDWCLYDVEWSSAAEGVVADVHSLGLTVVDARGNADRWSVRLRVDDGGDAAAFRRALADRGVRHELRRLRPLERASTGPARLLTRKQREALVLAERRGYYARPRETSLAALGEELGVDPSSVSQRLRLGHRNLVGAVLGRPAAEAGAVAPPR